MFFDLHRHDEFSFFDGFGKAKELAKYAKELGYPALGLSNHGNISGLVRHWKACKEVGVKPVLGCEVYFQPMFDKENPKREYFHLCLFVKNYKGYKNLCKMLSVANKKQFYFNPIITFELLEKYASGLICSTACISGYVSKALAAGKKGKAKKYLEKCIDIFGDDLYIEIQPYSIDAESTQERVNVDLMRLAREYGVKCILTSDSHYRAAEDFPTYCKMHEIAKHNIQWVKDTYSTRYMPSEVEIIDRFVEMHEYDFKQPYKKAQEMIKNMDDLYNRVDADIFEHCELKLPKIESKNSNQMLVDLTKKGLKKRGKYNKEYVSRCIKEIDTIHYHKFDDYFLMVQEYVNWAKEQGIAVGDGRGSVCNCLTAYAIGITNVDSIKYRLDFSRFMRKEKKKMPDIDVDFETARRDEVIQHVLERYPGQSVQICSYSEYNTDGLINDLAKVCGLPTDGETDVFERDENKKVIAGLKSFVHQYEIDGVLDIELIKKDVMFSRYNSEYDDILLHFLKLYKKVRNLGTHAAGVAVTGGSIFDYTCIVRRRSGGKEYYSSCYDLNDLESIKCIKFDMLGLQTLSELKELETYSKYVITEHDIEDVSIYEAFRNGETDGIFQMEKTTPKNILNMIECSSIEDVIAVNALNRPAPLRLKMHETMAYNKASGKMDTDSLYYQCTKETYGTMIYQEQTIEVAQRIGHLSSEQTFDLLKIMKKEANLTKPEYVPIIAKMKSDFEKGAKSEGLIMQEIHDLWASMLVYGFNKGHSTGYSLISVKQMFYKLYFPSFFYYVKMKYARNDADFYKFTRLAIKGGIVVFLPHVNYTALTSIRKKDGEYVLQQGLSTVKDVGVKAAQVIEDERKKNGCFKTMEEFEDRCKGQAVNAKTIRALKECGALQFNEKKYINCVIKYNSTMAVRK